MRALTQPIPTYRLYGEDNATLLGTGLAELIHCETIAARSRLHDWEISEHRHAALAQVLFVASGSVAAQLDGAEIAGQGPLLLVAPPGVAHGFRFAPDVEGLVLTMSDEFLFMLDPGDPLRGALDEAGPVIPQGDLARRLSAMGDELLDAVGAGRSEPRLRLGRALAEAWLRLALGERLAANAGESPPQRRFRELVERHYREHRPLSFYAGKLGFTERTLTRLARSAWGMSPLEIVNSRLALEAQRLLRFTNASCAEVAWELGFTDPSYFSRFYKRMTGTRPQAVRQAISPTS